MGRTIAVIWHASFSIAAAALYFFFVLPRWSELMGQTSPTLGTVLRIVAGVLIALAALPVVFTLLRTRKPEYGTPQLALTLRVSSIVAHVLAGVLIVGTAISEIWLSIDSLGQWLFGIYGAAAAIALLGVFAFYLSFVAELPPPPPKPLKPKKPKRGPGRKSRRKNRAEDEAAKVAKAAEGEETTETADDAEDAEVAVETAADEVPAGEQTPAEDEAVEAADSADSAEDVTEPASTAGLQNRRPSGKAGRRGRR